jgi:hypothetical protein
MTAPLKAVVRVNKGSTGLNVMEQAVTRFGRPFRFSATYFGARLGYFIDTINGVESDPFDSCFWFLFIRRPNGKEFLSPVGISNFLIRRNGYSIIWRFMQRENHDEF